MPLPGADQVGCRFHMAQNGTEWVVVWCCIKQDVPQPRTEGEVGCLLTAPVRFYHSLELLEGLQMSRVMNLMVEELEKYQ